MCGATRALACLLALAFVIGAAHGARVFGANYQATHLLRRLAHACLRLNAASHRSPYLLQELKPRWAGDRLPRALACSTRWRRQRWRHRRQQERQGIWIRQLEPLTLPYGPPTLSHRSATRAVPNARLTAPALLAVSTLRMTRPGAWTLPNPRSVCPAPTRPARSARPTTRPARSGEPSLSEEGKGTLWASSACMPEPALRVSSACAACLTSVVPPQPCRRRPPTH